MEKELVTIIVPVYNDERYIGRCINSLINQKYSNLDILIINDGSTDNTEKICKVLSNKDKRIRVINKKNGGVSSARNMGIELAKGKYIFFIDSDDTIDINAISTLVLNRKEKELVGISYRKCMRNQREYIKEQFIISILKNKELGVIWGYIFETEIIKKIMFDQNTSFMEDTMFLIQYIQYVEKVRIISENDSYYNHFFNDQGITNSPFRILNNIEDFIYSLEKINDFTKGKYRKYINKKEINLIEKECRKIDSDINYKKILNDKSIRKIIIKNKFKIFSIIYLLNNVYIIKLYYKFRKKIKDMYYLIKRNT